jgi:hypothetical protein
LLEERKNSIIVPIYKTGDKQIVVIIGHKNVATYVQNFIQNPAAIAKSNADEIIVNQFGFRRNR